MHMAFKGSLAHMDPRAGIAQCDGEPKFDGLPLSKPRDDRSQEVPAGPLRSRRQETALPSSGVASSCPL